MARQCAEIWPSSQPVVLRSHGQGAMQVWHPSVVYQPFWSASPGQEIRCASKVSGVCSVAASRLSGSASVPAPPPLCRPLVPQWTRFVPAVSDTIPALQQCSTSSQVKADWNLVADTISERNLVCVTKVSGAFSMTPPVQAGYSSGLGLRNYGVAAVSSAALAAYGSPRFVPVAVDAALQSKDCLTLADDASTVDETMSTEADYADVGCIDLPPHGAQVFGDRVDAYDFVPISCGGRPPPLPRCDVPSTSYSSPTKFRLPFAATPSTSAGSTPAVTPPRRTRSPLRAETPPGRVQKIRASQSFRRFFDGRLSADQARGLVEDLLFESLPRENVVEPNVDFLVNEASKERFLETLRDDGGSWAKVRVAWHLPGSLEAVSGIIADGISCDEQFCACGRYGRGGYVALSAAKANAYANSAGEGGVRRLFLVAALPGDDLVLGERGTRPRHTAADSRSCPTEYCVVDDARLHCVCLLTYQWAPTGRRKKVITADPPSRHVVAPRPPRPCRQGSGVSRSPSVG